MIGVVVLSVCTVKVYTGVGASVRAELLTVCAVSVCVGVGKASDGNKN